MTRHSSVLATLTLLSASLVAAAQVGAQDHGSQTSGLLTQSANIGVTQPGSVRFDSSGGVYTVTGGGADMWGSADDFFLASRRHSGDGALTAFITFPPGVHPPNEKAVLIFRQSLEPGSAYADVAIHADGHITLQWRAADGAITQDITAPPGSIGPIGITRSGNRFTAFVTQPGGARNEFAHVDVELKDPVYLGIGVCAHDAAGLATVQFSDVRIADTSGHSDLGPGPQR